VKVTFKGTMKDHMDFRDVVHATQAQMLQQQFGDNVFQGRVIEVHIGTLLADQAFTFTDWTAEMKAKASICISNDETLIGSLETRQRPYSDHDRQGHGQRRARFCRA
jgi:aconitate hydratase 2/2-methylisocitrate dehydratase